MLSRRKLLKTLSSTPFLGGLLGTGLIRSGNATATPLLRKRNYFKELGVRTFINAAGTYTAMTGCLMRDEVLDAITFASDEYVMLDDLQDKVGERIAKLVKCEAATVTAGAASALTLGTAGILSGMDQKKVVQIPHLEGTGMKTEVIMQKSHEFGYAHAVRNCGVNIVYIETRKELEKAINKNTALMLFLNANNYVGEIRDEEWVEIGKKYNIPTFNDCAADVPPKENLWKHTEMGFDLVCFSGGKGIRGPQSAGLLLGKKDLIAAARLHAPPRGNTVGRGMKVNKEEVLGMMVALEQFLANDLEKEWKMWEEQIAHIKNAVQSVDGVTTEVTVPEIANHVPTLNISWDPEKIKTNNAGIKEVLRNGHPSIEVAGWGDESISITTWMMVPGQERIVAERVRDALQSAATT